MLRNRMLKSLAVSIALALGAGYLSGARAADATPPATDTPSSGVYYEIFVRAWYDTDGEVIGTTVSTTA